MQSRVAIAVGVTSIGFPPFFRRLFKKSGVAVAPNLLHFLEVKHKQRERRLLKQKLTERKKKRMERKFESLKEQEEQAKTARAKRDGAHRRGGNMDGFDDGSGKKRAKKRPARVCPLCKKKGHSTTRSQKCICSPNHPDHDANRPVPTPEAVETVAEAPPVAPQNEKTLVDAADADAMDTIPFEDTENEDEEDLDLEKAIAGSGTSFVTGGDEEMSAGEL